MDKKAFIIPFIMFAIFIAACLIGPTKVDKGVIVDKSYYPPKEGRFLGRLYLPSQDESYVVTIHDGKNQDRHEVRREDFERYEIGQKVDFSTLDK